MSTYNLDPVTLRWVADLCAADADRARENAGACAVEARKATDAKKRGAWVRYAIDHTATAAALKKKARYLRTLATREEKRRA